MYRLDRQTIRWAQGDQDGRIFNARARTMLRIIGLRNLGPLSMNPQLRETVANHVCSYASVCVEFNQSLVSHHIAEQDKSSGSITSRNGRDVYHSYAANSKTGKTCQDSRFEVTARR